MLRVFPVANVVVASVRQLAWRLISMQVIAIMLVAMILLFFLGRNAGFSVLIGGATWLLPSVFFTWRLTRNMSPQLAKQFMFRFYSAEFMKFILAIVLSVFAFKYLPISFIAFMAGLVAALMSIWLVPLMIKKYDVMK